MNLQPMKQFANEDVVDAVVIGTGAGGAPLLARLARAGLNVVALEAGRNWEPAQDFATDEVAAEELYWLSERLSAGETPTAFGGNNSGTGVGGSTLHWGAFVPRADPRDFRLHTDSGVGVDWPITVDDLEPYYREIEAFLGVSGPERYPWDPTRRYPLPAVPLNAPAELMRTAFAALGLLTSEAPVAAVSRDYQQDGYDLRHACVNRGYCHQGCRNGAKASMDVTYLPVAVRAGAEIRPNSFVTEFEIGRSGHVESVLYTRGGHRSRQRCRAVFLCAGAVETPRLLLRCNAHEKEGLANSSGQVGRNFMAHVATQVWGTFEAETRPNKGFPASLISEDTLRPAGVPFAGGYITQSLGIVPMTWGIQVASGRSLWGEELVRYLRQYNHVAGIGINGDCLPSSSNYLELSDEPDEMGMKKAKVHFTYGENELLLSRHAEALMTAAWEAAGATDIWTFQRSAHTIGTCRMGNDRRDSVVDAQGRSFDVANLWICDNSVFPSALAANPALTIMALSLRTADYFLNGRRTS